MQRKQIASSTDQWKTVMVKKSAPARGARWKFPAKRIGGRRMFSHFYRLFRISGSRKKKAEPEDCVFSSLLHSISSIWSKILFALVFSIFCVLPRRYFFVCWMFDCWRCGAISMINSISVIFPFKYFIPFGPLDPLLCQKKNLVFLFSSLAHFARNYSSHTHDKKRTQTQSHIKKSISVSLEKIAVKMKLWTWPPIKSITNRYAVTWKMIRKNKIFYGIDSIRFFSSSLENCASNVSLNFFLNENAERRRTKYLINWLYHNFKTLISSIVIKKKRTMKKSKPAMKSSLEWFATRLNHAHFSIVQSQYF